MAYKIVKRAIDIAVSAALLVLLLLLLLALAVLVRLDTTGPAFFVQQRIGLGGRPFAMIKLRSMVRDASKGSYMTVSGDARITRIGRFLRLTSLDELPQLWNVLIGDMSLVGPRPETPAQRALYSDADWQARHRVRPGITGLAQTSGRSSLNPQDRLRYDLDYASGATLAMDMRILLKTALQLCSRAEAN